MHLKFTQKMTEKQENGTVYEKIMFFLFCNFFDDENKKIKKTFFKRQKKISFFFLRFYQYRHVGVCSQARAINSGDEKLQDQFLTLQINFTLRQILSFFTDKVAAVSKFRITLYTFRDFKSSFFSPQMTGNFVNEKDLWTKY